VTVLALIIDALLALAVWASVPGTGRLRKGSSRMPQPLLDDEVAFESRSAESRSNSESSPLDSGRTYKPGDP
jgi:osmoprotectant transport system permease protein